MNITALESAPLHDVITLETRKLISLYIGVIVHPPIFLLGLIGNLISICVFLKIGLNDSISVCFFSVCSADFICVIFLASAECSLMLSEIILQQWRVEGDTLSSLIMFYYGPVYDISQGITTFLAVQKCWCVALPFRFKYTFTKRTSFVVAGICLVCISLYAPILGSQGIRETFDKTKNTTLFKLMTSPNRELIMSARSTIALVTTTACQATVTACLVILASGLRASSKFRSAQINSFRSANLTETTLTNGQPVLQDSLKIFSNQKNYDSSDGRTINKRIWSTTPGRNIKISISPVPKRIHRKELNAIKSTTLVSVFFVVCAMPKLLIFYAILCEPEFQLLRRYENWYVLAITVRYMFEAFNISCYFFVHLAFNRRFRCAFHEFVTLKITN